MISSPTQPSDFHSRVEETECYRGILRQIQPAGLARYISPIYIIDIYPIFSFKNIGYFRYYQFLWSCFCFMEFYFLMWHTVTVLLCSPYVLLAYDLCPQHFSNVCANARCTYIEKIENIQKKIWFFVTFHIFWYFRKNHDIFQPWQPVAVQSINRESAYTETWPAFYK